MRIALLTLLVCLPLLTNGQESNELIPVTVSPIIGDTLDQEEREYFGFFTRPRRLDGFRHAVFLAAPDGSLAMKVARESGATGVVDTLIATGYTRQTVERALSSVLRENKGGHEWGRAVTIVLRNGRRVVGKCVDPGSPSYGSYGAAYGLLAGAGAGLLTGLILGVGASEADQEFEFSRGEALAAMRSYARFPGRIPPFIQRIEELR